MEQASDQLQQQLAQQQHYHLQQRQLHEQQMLPQAHKTSILTIKTEQDECGNRLQQMQEVPSSSGVVDSGSSTSSGSGNASDSNNDSNNVHNDVDKDSNNNTAFVNGCTNETEKSNNTDVSEEVNTPPSPTLAVNQVSESLSRKESEEHDDEACLDDEVNNGDSRSITGDDDAFVYSDIPSTVLNEEFGTYQKVKNL